MQEVQRQRQEDNRAFAKPRKELLSTWDQHKKACKREGEEPDTLNDFAAQEYGYDDLTPLEVFCKRLQNPGGEADCGHHELHVERQVLCIMACFDQALPQARSLPG